MRNFSSASSAIITILLSVVLLFLFHFESLYLGPIKVSHLWKGSLLVYLLFVLLQKGKVKPYIYGPLILLSIMQLVNVELINNPVNSVILFATALILPLIGMYAFKFSPKQLQKTLLFFSSFFILCFIPYVLGLLTSLVEGYDLTIYGGEFGLVGPFQNPHTASMTLAASLIVIVYFWLLGTVNKAYFGALIIFGFYCLLTTYVRTGLAMLLVASIPMLTFFVKMKAGIFIRAVLVGATFIYLAFLWVGNNPVLMDRIAGKSIHFSENTFESAGSGRGGLYLNALEVYSETSIIKKIIGMGTTEKVNRIHDKMEESQDAPIGAHNAFLDILLGTGGIGLLLFFIFLRNIYKLINSSDNQYRTLGTSMFMAYLIMSFLQGYERITVCILFFLTLALMAKTKN